MCSEFVKHDKHFLYERNAQFTNPTQIQVSLSSAASNCRAFREKTHSVFIRTYFSKNAELELRFIKIYWKNYIPLCFVLLLIFFSTKHLVESCSQFKLM